MGSPNPPSSPSELARLVVETVPSQRKQLVDQLFVLYDDDIQQLMLFADAVLKCRKIGPGCRDSKKLSPRDRRNEIQIELFKALRHPLLEPSEILSGWNWLNSIITKRLSKTADASKLVSTRNLPPKVSCQRDGTGNHIAKRRNRIDHGTLYKCSSVFESQHDKITFVANRLTPTLKGVFNSILALARQDHGLTTPEQDLRIALENDLTPSEATRLRLEVEREFRRMTLQKDASKIPTISE